MQSKRRLVAERSFTARPEPRWNKPLLISWRKIHEPEHSALRSFDTTRINMVLKQRERKANLARVIRREVSGLARRHLIQAIPIGMGS